jgi:HAD superfamily hydrolase (TIGR01509 family)
MRFDLVVFDCDGVLVDSEKLINRIHSELLALCGFAIGEAELLERFCGMSDREACAIIERDWGRALPADYADRVAAAVAREYPRSLTAIAGAASLLTALPVPFCVASSSVPGQIRRALAAAGLARYFGDNVFSAAEVAQGKPAPDLFLYAAARMGAVPGRCAVVEDSLFGVAAARAAGMTAIGFTGGSHCLPGHGARLSAAGAARVVARMTDLPAALDLAP